jgi:predicted GIY-YIG superfamily endonuclease
MLGLCKKCSSEVSKQHQQGKNRTRTRAYRPFALIYVDAFGNEKRSTGEGIIFEIRNREKEIFLLRGIRDQRKY